MQISAYHFIGFALNWDKCKKHGRRVFLWQSAKRNRISPFKHVAQLMTHMMDAGISLSLCLWAWNSQNTCPHWWIQDCLGKMLKLLYSNLDMNTESVSIGHGGRRAGKRKNTSKSSSSVYRCIFTEPYNCSWVRLVVSVKQSAAVSWRNRSSLMTGPDIWEVLMRKKRNLTVKWGTESAPLLFLGLIEMQSVDAWLSLDLAASEPPWFLFSPATIENLKLFTILHDAVHTLLHLRLGRFSGIVF